jgi:putative DNA primase/helicase
VLRLALAACRARYKAAITVEDADRRKTISKYAIDSEIRVRLEACLAIARCLLPIADNGEHWDENPWLFCAKNGVVALKTGELKPGDQSDRITMQSPVAYDAEAKASRWLSFLDEVFNADSELIGWLQKYLGYCLSGDTREQILAMGHGSGANGKGRLLAALRYVLGDYAYDAPFSTFELAARAVIPNDLAALVGRRFVTSSETNTGTQFNEARIKALTGQDAVTARFLHCEFFTFQPAAKYFLAVNYRPRVHDDSYGFWRRVRLIPFNREFKGAEDDKMLLDKLIAEAPGILNWLIEGCCRWQKEGMDPTPECVTRATTEYQTESDPLSEFLLDECVISGQAQAKSSQIYRTYQNWCRNQGIPEKEILTLNAFGRRMGKNYKKEHKEGGAVYKGLGMKADGFLTEFVPTSKNYEVIDHSTRVEGNKYVNPSESVIPSVLDTKLENSSNPPKTDDFPPYPEENCPKCGGDWTLNDNCTKYICSGCGYEYEG